MNINFNTYSPARQSRSNTVSRRNSISSHSQPVNANAAPRSQDTVILSAQLGRKGYITEETLAVSESDNAGSEGTALPVNVNISYFGKRISLYKNTIEEYYAKRNEENKKFPDPQKHIWRKYWDRNYEHYEKGLTESEREWGWEQESGAYCGVQVSLSPYDPAILKAFGGPGNGSFPIDDALKARQSMNEALNQIFKENGIVIPDGTDLRLTVDPYDYFIRVSGVDEKLAEKIEAALNKGENGNSLYSHISFSNPGHYGVAEEPPQYSKGNPWKTSLFLAVKESTGYDLRELEWNDGQFLTPDGQNVWDLMDDKYKNDYHFYTYRLLAGYGWDYVADQDLTIGYKEGSLYDIDTQYGYGSGQTSWIDVRRENDKKEQESYMRERAETLRREESMPNRYERAFASVETPDGIKVNAAADGSYAGLFSKGVLEQKPISAMLMAQMSSAIKSGKGALTSEILGIPNTVARKTGFNMRA